MGSNFFVNFSGIRNMFDYSKDSIIGMENIIVTHSFEKKNLAVCYETYTVKKLYEEIYSVLQT